MTSPGSVTQWIHELEDGDPDAAAKLWQRYGGSLLQLAQRRLGAKSRRVSDEEDVALTAFAQFCQGVQAKRFAHLTNRDDLWHVLVMLTVRKSVDQVRRETRRRERGGSVFRGPAESSGSAAGFEQLPADRTAPDVAVQAMETCRSLLERLDDETLRQIACWKLVGHSNEEIAGKLGCVTRTVERKLALIRRKWEAAAAT